MAYARLMWPVSVDQLLPHDASRRAGSAGGSSPLAEFYMAKGRFLRPKARPADSAVTGPAVLRQAARMEIT
jgi:hypothetical protein